MSLRFHRSLKIAAGLRLDLSRSGFGLSAGVKGFRTGVNAQGRHYRSMALPGTGLSYRTYEKASRGARE
jgi:hypothetical protein